MDWQNRHLLVKQLKLQKPSTCMAIVSLHLKTSKTLTFAIPTEYDGEFEGFK
jgi:hypothetical protein